MITLAFDVRSVLLSASEGSSLHRVLKNSVLFRQGQEQQGLYLIQSGMVKLTTTSRDGSRLISSVAGPHQLLGEECFIQGFRSYQAEAMTLTDVECVHLMPRVLKALLDNSALALALISYVASRQMELTHKLEVFCLRDVEYRILYGLADLAGLVTPVGSFYPIPMTQSEIASYVGATRETTSTVLSGLRRRQLLTLARRLVTTVHPDLLITAANNSLAHVKGQGAGVVLNAHPAD